jgi:hypothetical protein
MRFRVRQDLRQAGYCHYFGSRLKVAGHRLIQPLDNYVSGGFGLA